MGITSLSRVDSNHDLRIQRPALLPVELRLSSGRRIRTSSISVQSRAFYRFELSLNLIRGGIIRTVEQWSRRPQWRYSTSGIFLLLIYCSPAPLLYCGPG